jgi:hypothetical protein
MLYIYGSFTSGTVTGAVAQIELPTGFVIGGTTAKRAQVGYLTRAGTAGPFTVMAVEGRTYLTFGGGASSHGDVAGSSLVGSSENLKLTAYVPVTANSPCPAAPMPQLKHAVTTSSEGVERVERVRFGGSSELSSCTSSPCTIYSQSGNWVSSITRNAVGSYTINFVSGIFSAPPSCTCLANQPGLDDAVCGGAPNNSTSTKTINTRNSTSAYRVDTTVEVICMGPR